MDQETKYKRAVRIGKKYKQRCVDLYKEKKKLWDELADAEEEITQLEEEVERLKRMIAEFGSDKEQ